MYFNAFVVIYTQKTIIVQNVNKLRQNMKAE